VEISPPTGIQSPNRPARSQSLYKLTYPDFYSSTYQLFNDTITSSDDIYPTVSLTTSPLPLQKRFLHTVRSSASSFNLMHPLLFSRPSSSCLPLLSRLPVTYSLYLSFRRQFLRNILKPYNVEHFEMEVNNCIGQRNECSVPKFAGTVVKKHVNCFMIAYGPNMNRNSKPICRIQVATTPARPLSLH